MRKITAAVLVLFIFMISLTACNNPQPANTTIETPVTVETANAEGRYAARAYIESLFWGKQSFV